MMKKKILGSLTPVLLIAVILLFLNISVTTKQGINYQVKALKIPLYLKILDFFDRHYNYEYLVKRITKDSRSQEDKVLKIFFWTSENIRRQPQGLPVVDDHVWSIIVRGYGMADQANDVFSTLCNYAGAPAFCDYVLSEDNVSRTILSYVKINGQWHIFDPYNGVYFVNSDNKLAVLNDLESGNWHLEQFGAARDVVPDFRKYSADMAKKRNVGLKRENIQSPLRRIMFQLVH